MDKVLINLYVPSVNMRFDIQIPLFLPVKLITQLLAKMMGEVTSHRYVSSGQEFLCSIDQNMLFRQEFTLKDYNVQNGEHLLFS